MKREFRSLSVILVCFVLCSDALSVSTADEETSGPVASIDDLVADLDSDEFAVRKRATLQLIKQGKPSIAPLVAAAKSGPLEVRSRAIRILQEFFAGSDDDATINAAEQALESLAESKNRALAASAERVLNSYYERREKRALAQIKQLGGVIHYRKPDDLFFRRNVVDPNKKQLGYVLLGSRWKGGDVGLKYVKRLSNLEILYLSGLGEKSPISKEAELSLQVALPNLKVEHRGHAYLGIGGGPHPRGCQIVQVKPGAAAAKAGLQERDVITAFGDKKITDFSALIAHISNFSPGDKVKVEILRGADTLTLEVIMGEWE